MPKTCEKRHPSLCKYFQEKGCCKFGEGCAYAHIVIVKKNDVNKLSEEITNMKAEMNKPKEFKPILFFLDLDFDENKSF